MTNSSLSIGAVIDDRYELLQELGAGGFGTVYKARQLSTGQFVAIKVMARKPEGRRAGLEIARFEREMKLISELRHPNIVNLVDSGRLEDDDRFFIVLEFIDGLSLDDLLTQGPVAIRTAHRIMTQVMEALRYAHTRGVVHRDLKPANIMVTDPGPRCAAKVLDFGIAAITEDARKTDYRTLTGAGQLPGTLAYMAPEQIGDGPLTPSIDLFSWGLVFHELLTGRPVIAGDSLVKLIFKQMSAEPIALSPLLADTDIGALVARCIAKDPESRFENADLVLDALDDLPVRGPEIDAIEAAMREDYASNPPEWMEAGTTGAGLALGETNDSQPSQTPVRVSNSGGRTGEIPAPKQSPRDTGEVAIANPGPLGPGQLSREEQDIGAAETLGEDTDVTPSQEPHDDEPEFVARPPVAATTQNVVIPTRANWSVPAVVMVVVLLAGVAWWLTREPPLPAPETTAATDDAPEPRCAPGMTATDSTDGHCCWPGQAWQPSTQLCIGVPIECPQGLVASANGCMPEAVIANVAPEADGQPATFTLPPAPGVVVVGQSSPSGAKVIIDGHPRGTAPGQFDNVPLGSIVVVLQATGHDDLIEVVEVGGQPAETKLVNTSLEPLRNGRQPSMVLIPAQRFWMGCLPSDPHCEPQESPGREFEVGHSFEIDKTEVSVAAYDACIDAGACIAPPPVAGARRCNWNVPGRELHPMNCISFHGAQMFCEWLGKRLPTESEWELAARLDSQTQYPWGDEKATCAHAVVRDGGNGCGRDMTWHVWAKPEGRTTSGLFNMAGNVEEWTADWYARDFLTTATELDPRGPSGGHERTGRGGGFDDDPLDLRISGRDGEIPRDGDDDLGFRCAR